MTGDGTHRVELTFGDGVYIKLICPDAGCTPATTCAQCGRDVNSGTEDGCYDCKDALGIECWIRGWVENPSAEELLHGKVTLPVDALFDGDSLILEIDEAASALGDAS